MNEPYLLDQTSAVRHKKYKDVTQASIDQYLNRIGNIQENTPRLWGKMTPAQMLAHVRLLVEGSLGEVKVEGNGQIPFKWVKGIVLSGAMPFPKGKLKSPSPYLYNGAHDVTQEREQLEDALNRFLDLCGKEPGRVQLNAVFGPLTMKEWQRLHGLHLNHHLAQFGA